MAAALLLQVAMTAMLWGAGTAMGEVPPYFISYSAAKAGKRNEMMEEVQEVGAVVTGIQQECTGLAGLVLAVEVLAGVLAVARRPCLMQPKQCSTQPCMHAFPQPPHTPPHHWHHWLTPRSPTTTCSRSTPTRTPTCSAAPWPARSR